MKKNFLLKKVLVYEDIIFFLPKRPENLIRKSQKDKGHIWTGINGRPDLELPSQSYEAYTTQELECLVLLMCVRRKLWQGRRMRRQEGGLSW